MTERPPDEFPGPPPDALVRWPVLATRNARLLLATRLVGQAADGLLQAALGSFVLFSPQRQATAGQVAAAFALLLLPYSLVGPFAGVLLDRWSRVRVLLWANLGRAGGALAMAAVVSAGSDDAALAAAVLVTLGLGRLVLAGLSASLPHAIAREHLVTANALFPTAGSIASAIATVIGLLGMRLLGPDAPTRLVLAVAAGMGVAGLIASRIPVRALGPSAQERAAVGRLGEELVAVVRGMVEGVGHLRQRRPAARAVAVVVAHRIAFGMLLVDILLLLRATLNPPQATGAALADFAITAAGASLGALLGAVVTPAAVRRVGLRGWSGSVLLMAAVVCPVATSMLTLGSLVVASLAIGFAGQAVKVVGDTTLQRSLADEYRGRVFSLYDVLLNAGLVAGISLAAVASPPSGVAPGLWIVLFLTLFTTGLWTLRSGREEA